MDEIKKKQKPTKADLKRRILDLEAQIASTYHFASKDLDNVAYPALMGSAVIIEMRALGGQTLMKPVAIRGGLSDDTISCLRRDIARSYDEAVGLKPVLPGVKA